MLTIGLAALAQGATVSLDIDRAITLYHQAPTTMEQGSASFVWYGPSDRPATWVGARVGLPADLLVFRLTPEATVGTSVVGTSWYDTTPSTELRATTGLRLGVASPISPGLYGHVGWGWGWYDAPVVGRGQENAVTMDAGAYLDLKLDHLIVGVHAGYQVFPSWWGNANSLDAGVNLGVAF